MRLKLFGFPPNRSNKWHRNMQLTFIHQAYDLLWCYGKHFGIYLDLKLLFFRWLLLWYYVMEPIQTNFRFWCCCWKQEFDQFSSWFRLMLFAWCRYDPFILAAFPPPPIIDPCPFSSAAHLPGVPCPVPTLFLSITFPLTYVHCILSIHILCTNLPSYCANCSKKALLKLAL